MAVSVNGHGSSHVVTGDGEDGAVEDLEFAGLELCGGVGNCSAVPSAATAVLMSVRTTEPVARVPVQSASMVSPFITAVIAYS